MACRCLGRRWPCSRCRLTAIGHVGRVACANSAVGRAKMSGASIREYSLGSRRQGAGPDVCVRAAHLRAFRCPWGDRATPHLSDGRGTPSVGADLFVWLRPGRLASLVATLCAAVACTPAHEGCGCALHRRPPVIGGKRNARPRDNGPLGGECMGTPPRPALCRQLPWAGQRGGQGVVERERQLLGLAAQPRHGECACDAHYVSCVLGGARLLFAGHRLQRPWLPREGAQTWPTGGLDTRGFVRWGAPRSAA